MADDVSVYTSLSRLCATLGQRSLARSGLLTMSLLVALMIVVYMCSDCFPVVISAHGLAERVLKSENTACSHDESMRYLQELVSIFIVSFRGCVYDHRFTVPLLVSRSQTLSGLSLAYGESLVTRDYGTSHCSHWVQRNAQSVLYQACLPAYSSGFLTN